MKFSCVCINNKKKDTILFTVQRKTFYQTVSRISTFTIKSAMSQRYVQDYLIITYPQFLYEYIKNGTR